MSRNRFVASQLILVFRPEVNFGHVQKSIRGLNIVGEVCLLGLVLLLGRAWVARRVGLDGPNWPVGFGRAGLARGPS